MPIPSSPVQHHSTDDGLSPSHSTALPLAVRKPAVLDALTSAPSSPHVTHFLTAMRPENLALMQGTAKGKDAGVCLWYFNSQWQENSILNFHSFGLTRKFNLFPLAVESKEFIFKFGT